MNSETIELLKEVNSGCKNATDSIEQILEYVKDGSLREILQEYDKSHIKIGDACHRMLNEAGKDEQDPTSMAKIMMWLTTEMKMMAKGDDHKAAELIMDGCNMGIKSLGRAINQYDKAEIEASSMAGDVMKIEDELYKKLTKYL